jgi:fructokinase
MEKNKQRVVCFGEILWDNLPGGRKPGGAPMNVAFHLNKLGKSTALISRIGNDNSGLDLFNFIEEIGISAEYCQTDFTYKTSSVEVVISENNEVSYDIVYPTTWDFIQHESRLDKLSSDADAFIFGSLSARNSVSRHTLYTLLEKSSYKVFDVNLRDPHYTKESITEFLVKTNLLKLNLQELTMLSDWFCDTCSTEQERINVIQNQFPIDEILVTKGSSGASYYTPNTHHSFPAYQVSVSDTVGSGDAFLAAFLAQKLDKNSIEKALQYASALGAYVTMNSGACPAYQIQDLDAFISQQEFNKKSLYQLANQ